MKTSVVCRVILEHRRRLRPAARSSIRAIGRQPMLVALVVLVAALACDSYPGQDLKRREFVAEHRLGNSNDASLRPTVYRTRLVVDPAQGQVRELRYVTTALGNDLAPDISVWGKDHAGFATGSKSSCRIFDNDNFACYVLPGGLGDDVEEWLSHGFGSQLRMELGNLTEISSGDTIRYRTQTTHE